MDGPLARTRYLLMACTAAVYIYCVCVLVVCLAHDGNAKC